MSMLWLLAARPVRDQDLRDGDAARATVHDDVPPPASDAQVATGHDACVPAEPHGDDCGAA